MREILVDGANITLHSAKQGKLTSLECLASVIHALLANRVVPYSIFDASFRYRIAEKSLARTTFDHLTHNVKEYFQKSPTGEEADLFLLEMACATEFPVLSNDSFSKYGKLKDGILPYKGTQIHVLNYHVMAGTVVIPDLEIRHRIPAGEDSLYDIEAAFEKARAPAPATHGADDSAAGEGAEFVGAADEVIGGYLNGQRKPLAPLGAPLADHKRRYQVENGVGNRGRRAWFGYPTLAEFIGARLPHYRVDGDNIEPREPG